MIKKILTASLAFSLLLLFAMPVLAADPVAPKNPAGEDLLQYLDATAQKGGLADKPAGEDDLMNLVAGIINTVLSLTGVIFFGYVFYHGFRWMTAGGNDEIISEAKSGIKQSIIGIVIVFSAFTISNFVINRIQLINEPAGTAPTAPATIPDAGDPNAGQLDGA